MSVNNWYAYRQNNSGGRFEHDEVRGVSILVVIEAESASAANSKAEKLGIYFDGCEDGIDCECCGDRWYQASERDAEREPTYYGNPLERADGAPPVDWGLPIYVHPANSSFYSAKVIEQ